MIERYCCQIKQWRGLATRYDKHAIVYRAVVILDAVIAWTHLLSAPR
ncbi:transposase [Microbacterium sp. Au-Mic1]|nr:transposase [Microbacterium sp. Au-Mic1]MCE4026263.1 transposase [Microbacterium sp. Au-Mic1]